jgi:hypothetical protein
MNTTTITRTVATPRPLMASRLVGGIGGLAFVASVILQNAMRAGFPGGDASAHRIATYYAAHRGITIALAILFPIGAAGLAGFVGAILSRVQRGAGRAAALMGAVGVAGVIGNYTMLLASDIAIAGYVHRGSPQPAVIDGLWVLHNAVFAVLLASIGVALAGLTAAASSHGLLAKRWRTVGGVGGLLLLIGAATAPAIVDGSKTMAIGLAGFLVWVVFIVTASVTMLRGDEPAY